MLSYFSVGSELVHLDLPATLYMRVYKLAVYLRVPRQDILALACGRYGVSTEAVEKYLAHDMREEMRIAENCEL
ncbi:MAG: hypothetical protein Q8L24_01165 [bacterium]|nr:hypothetical protein [bacterium]